MQIVLTKCDLLNPVLLAGSIEIVKSSLNAFIDELDLQAQNVVISKKEKEDSQINVQSGSLDKSPAPPSEDNNVLPELRAAILPNSAVSPPVIYPRLNYDECVVPVSASTGSGIATLWKSMADCVRQSVRNSTMKGEPLLPHAVREHVNANKLRRRAAAAALTRSSGR